MISEFHAITLEPHYGLLVDHPSHPTAPSSSPLVARNISYWRVLQIKLESPSSASESTAATKPKLAAVMASSKILRHYSLERNPFVDRTAEKSNLSDNSYYILSDLQARDSSMSYSVSYFFGSRYFSTWTSCSSDRAGCFAVSTSYS